MPTFAFVFFLSVLWLVPSPLPHVTARDALDLDSLSFISVKPEDNFFGYWFTNREIPVVVHPDRVLQVASWANAVLFHHPDANIYLFVQRGTFPKDQQSLLDINHLHIINLEHYSDLLQGTPAASIKVPQKTSQARISDLCRLSVLYRWGGSWLDIDDILLRPITTPANTLGVAEFPDGNTNCPYMICRISRAKRLIPGTLISDSVGSYGLHVQNDPMLNWKRGNAFLFDWLSAAKHVDPVDWGRTLPTELLFYNSSWILDNHVALRLHHELLIHPAYANDGGVHKGPLFPPYWMPKKTEDIPNYDTLLNRTDFWLVLKKVLEISPFYVFKNHKLIGVIQCNHNATRRWMIGWIAGCHRQDIFLQTLRQIGRHDIRVWAKELRLKRPSKAFTDGNNGIIMGSRPSTIRAHINVVAPDSIPSIAYNPSIVRIPSQVWSALCSKLHSSNFGCDIDDTVFAISWFVKASDELNRQMGCSIWIGFVSGRNVLSALDGDFINSSNFWILNFGAPRMVKNVVGPKFADPRIFMVLAKGEMNLAVVGHARLAPSSLKDGNADYYVRTSLVAARAPGESLCSGLNNSCDTMFSMGHAECFPACKVCCVPQLDGSGDLLLPCTGHYCSDVLHPHSSRTPLMPSGLLLNGVEVSFDMKSSNERANSYKSRKDIVPVVYDVNQLSRGIGVFIDFTPSTESPPLVTALDMMTGETLGIWDMLVVGDGISESCAVLVSSTWRGGTQVVSLQLGRDLNFVESRAIQRNLFVSVLQHRTSLYSSRYRHIVVIFRGSYVNLSDRGQIFAPLECVGVLRDDPLEAFADNLNFAFATGLAGFPQKLDRRWTFILSVGLSNDAAYFTVLTLDKSYVEPDEALSYTASIVAHNASESQCNNCILEANKIPAFVITLPKLRPKAMHDFREAWKTRWPELEILQITGKTYRTRGRGLTATIYDLLEKAYFHYNFSYIIIFEDDARPFQSIYAQNVSLNDRFRSLLRNWRLESPTLFLGGHSVHNLTTANLKLGLTSIKACFGTYGWVIRRQHMLKVAKLCRRAFNRGDALSVDLLISSAVGTNDETGNVVHPVIATPLLVDHLSNQYSETWHRIRTKSSWEGRDSWWDYH